MKYREKIKYAELVAKDILNDKPIETIRAELIEKKLYERDIDAIIISAKNVIGEQLRPLIRSKLLAKEPIKNAPEFEKLDAAILMDLEQKEIKSLVFEERRKVRDMLKNKATPDEIYAAVRQDFYPEASIEKQISTYNEVKKQNSGGYRLLRMLGGIAIILISIGVSYLSVRPDGTFTIFYGWIIIGILLSVTAFQTIELPK